PIQEEHPGGGRQMGGIPVEASAEVVGHDDLLRRSAAGRAACGVSTTTGLVSADAARWCRPPPCGGGPRSRRGVYTFTIPQRDACRRPCPPCRGGPPLSRVAHPPQGRVSAHGALRHDFRAGLCPVRVSTSRSIPPVAPTIRQSPVSRTGRHVEKT